MKEIEELLGRATESVTSHGAFGEPELHHRVDLEKFAELIINECLNEIRIECTNPYRNMEDSEEYGIIALKESIKRIKRRFGIEE